MEVLDIYLGVEHQYVPRLSIHCLTEEQAISRQRKQKWVQKKKGKALTSRTLQKQAYNYLFTKKPEPVQGKKCIAEQIVICCFWRGRLVRALPFFFLNPFLFSLSTYCLFFRQTMEKGEERTDVHTPK